ncbi:MAG: aspartate aminotransferase family protein [Geminicoccus sp.]|nr:aspartate aminotransferase family protein [Geminicoccus sp.]
MNRSDRLFSRAQELMPGGVNSPVRAFRAVGGTPVYPRSGSGQFIVDEDGREFLDYCMSWGPLILGHAHPLVVEQVKSAVDRGLSFGMPCEAEIDLSERVLSVLPGESRVRFVNSGTEAVMTAIRLARGVTGRDVVAKFTGCYHGHADHLLVKAGSGLATFGTASSAGVPESMVQDMLVLPLDNSEAVEAALRATGERLAAVVIEAIPANNGLLVQRPEFLKMLRRVTRELGALIVSDEVLTGYRVGAPHISLRNGLEPDILTLGKVVGGGMPVGAIAGSKSVMDHLAPDGPVYQAGTLSGNPIGMTAGAATLRVLEESGAAERLEELGGLLEEGFGAIVGRLGIPACMQRAGSIFWMALDAHEPPRSAETIVAESMDKYRTLHGSMLSQGIYLAPSGYEVGFLSTAHTEGDIQRTLEALETGLKKAYA